MTYHIITISTPGTKLKVDRGSLVAEVGKGEGATEKRIPLEDVRGVVVAVPSVAFTNQAIARLLDNNAVILHCDEKYQPIGWTTPLNRTVKRAAFLTQIAEPTELKDELWAGLLGQKLQNQAEHLTLLGQDHGLHRLIARPLVSEGNVAKQYWQGYFQALNAPQRREYPEATSFENGALNYGYAVMSTLIHRAILIHGLLPDLGVHHQPRAGASPLVYDILEPFRAFVEHLLWLFVQDNPQPEDQLAENRVYFQQWITFMMTHLRTLRIKRPQDKHSYKLMDSVDRCVRSVAACYEQGAAGVLWLPDLRYAYIHIEGTPLVDNEEDSELPTET